jgi:hypothetical protein
VGHHNHGDVETVQIARQLLAHSLAQGRIQCAERLVEQKDVRLSDECPRQSRPLLLTPGEC